MTAARWARHYSAALLTQLEEEEEAGWPELPWPPPRPALPTTEQVDVLRRLLAYLYDSLLADERNRAVLARQRARQTWLDTGRSKVSA